MHKMSSILIKKTPARSSITDFLGNSNYPVDIEQIIKSLRDKNLNTNKVTVYRIMDFLFENNIVDRLEFGEGKFRYELKKDHHHHLICQNCEKIEDVEGSFVEEIEKEIGDNKGFLVKSHSLEFFGLCKDCRN